MAQRAKLFKAGGSLAVQLPQDFGLEEEDEVLVSWEGENLVLIPLRRQWSQEFLDLAGSAPDFPYPDEPAPAEAGPVLK